MDSIINHQIACLKTFIMKSFKESEKKHLFITGSKKAGKTTVLSEILKDETLFGGIVTYVVRDNKIPPKYVMLSDINNSNIKGIIAKRNELATSLIPLVDTFDNLGANILRKYIRSNIELIVIDEIGFLEDLAIKYQRTVLSCLEHKRAIFVLRKESTPFIDSIIEREDVCLIDIDVIRPNIFSSTGYNIQ